MTDAATPPVPPDDAPAPVEPTTPGSPTVRGRRSAVGGVGLGILAFAATLILLFGLLSVVRPSGDAGGRPSSVSSAAAADANGSSSASASPTRSPALPSGSAASAPPAAAEAWPSGPPTSASSSAPPSAPAGGDPVLVGAGDIADCGLDADSATAALLGTIEGTVFTAGDNAYPDGTAAQFRDCYDPTWGRYLARTRPAPGNHDWDTKDLAGYLGYFQTAAAPASRSWYSYDLGAWHVVVLDSDCSFVKGCGPDSDQGRWLAGDLAASKARCTLAIWHHPRFSSGEHGNDAKVGPFWRALYDAGADVVVNGHDHDYERFAPQDPDGGLDRERGVREFVVGTGGAALRGFPTTAANSELRAAVVHGVIRLVLHPTSYEWRFVPASGAFGDAGSAPCH